MKTEGFHCGKCGFRCTNPTHVHHECLHTEHNELVRPEDHKHEGCVCPEEREAA